jgi:hypothetical protein
MPSPSPVPTSRRCEPPRNGKATSKPELLASRTLVGCELSLGKTGDSSNACFPKARCIHWVFILDGDGNSFFFLMIFSVFDGRLIAA